MRRVIAFHPEIAEALGNDQVAAIYYQQLYYWQDKGARNDGFIYKSKAEITEETTLSREQQDRIRKKLESLGWLETKVVKANGSPTLHYKCLKQLEITISGKDTGGNVGKTPLEECKTHDSLTEITAEITTKNNSTRSANSVKEDTPKAARLEEQKIKSGHPDFLNQLLALFQDAYEHEFGHPYIVVNPGRDRQMIAAVLRVAKAKNPTLGSDEMLTEMASFFASAMKVPDRWLRANMSPSLLSTKFNEIRSAINGNGKKQLDPEKLARGYREVYGDLAGGGEEL